MKLLFALILIFIFVQITPNQVFAELVINEFSSGTSDDWVELYNTGNSEIDLSNYYLIDGKENILALTGNLAPNNFEVFNWSNRLNNPGDIFKLINRLDNALVVSEVVYGDQGGLQSPTSEQSIGRIPDGTGDFVLLSIPTKKEANNSSAIILTPTVAPTFTPTPSPTTLPSKTPTPTKTSTPIPTAKPSDTPIPSKKLTPVITQKKIPTTNKATPTEIFEKAVLGNEIMENNEEIKLSPTPMLTVKGINNTGYIFISLGGVSLIACGILAYYLKSKA